MGKFLEQKTSVRMHFVISYQAKAVVAKHYTGKSHAKHEKSEFTAGIFF